MDRRKHVRTELRVVAKISARLEAKDRPAEVLILEVRDVSEVGLRLCLDRELPTQEFRLVLALSELAAGFTGDLILPCRTAWSRQTPCHRWECGIEFDTSPEAAVLFQKMLIDLVSPQTPSEQPEPIAL